MFEKKVKKRGNAPPTLWSDLFYLVGKVVLVGLVLLLLDLFLFGVIRYNDNGMTPAVKDGDLVVYYRLDKSYKINDLLTYHYEGKNLVARVVATAGDTVDITDDGVIINGNRQQEDGIYEKTVQYKKGIRFPVKVPEGHVFVLGDNRKSATDSRIFGTIPVKKTEGKVVVLARRRGL